MVGGPKATLASIDARACIARGGGGGTARGFGDVGTISAIGAVGMVSGIGAGGGDNAAMGASVPARRGWGGAARARGSVCDWSSDEALPGVREEVAAI